MSDHSSHEQTIDEALQQHGSGNLAEAERLYRRVLDDDPRHPGALHLLGVIALQKGDARTAIKHIDAALQIVPDDVEARSNLGNALQALGRFDAAIEAYLLALGSQPAMPQVRANLGNARLRLGDLRGAVEDYRAALAIEPRLPEVQRNLAQVLLTLGDPEAAWRSVQRARQLNPQSLEVALTMGNVLQALGRSQDAQSCFRQLVAARPDFAPAHSSLANALRANGQLAEAQTHYDRVLALTPDDSDAHYNRGLLHQDRGEMDRAVACLRTAIRLDPGCAKAHRVLASLLPHGGRDADIEALEDLLAASRPSDEQKMHAAFGLGKALEDIGDYDAAFENFTRANRLRRRAIEYRTQADAQFIANLKTTFSGPIMATHAGAGTADDTPILIVGMPRSGTTLVEQILASHPRVHGAGELSALAQSIGAHLETVDGVDYTRAFDGSDDDTLRRIGEDYTQSVRALNPDARHVTDKMPMNFLHLGLAALIVPHVRVVHCRRDPVATCLSIYKNFLPQRGHNYAYDLRELGSFYRLYRDLMAHWTQVLPRTPIEVSYEALVADQESVTRTLIEDCGLDWDPACLAFHENRRPVATLSAVQVRRPIYSDSVALWRRYERQLAPLIDILGDTGTAVSGE